MRYLVGATIFPYDFTKISGGITEGGVADLKTALTMKPITYTYPIAKDSEIDKALKNKEEVFINITSNSDKSIPLQDFYEIETVLDKETENQVISTNSPVDSIFIIESLSRLSSLFPLFV